MGDRLHAEFDTRNASKDEGIRRDRGLPLHNFRTSAGLTLTAGTTPKLGAIDTDVDVIQWAFNTTAAAFVKQRIQVPGEFARDFNCKTAGEFLLRVIARKTDADGDDTENATLKLRANIVTGAYPLTTANPVPGGSPVAATYTAGKVTLATPLDSLLAPADSWAGLDTGFKVYEFDLGAALLSEGKLVEPHGFLEVRIGPSTTVGTTNMTLEVAHAYFRWREHLADFHLKERGSP